MVLHEISKTRDALAIIWQARMQWEDGLITDLEMIHEIDKAMLDYLTDKQDKLRSL